MTYKGSLKRPEIKATLTYRHEDRDETKTIEFDILGLSRDELLEHYKDFTRLCGFYVGLDDDIYIDDGMNV